MVGRASAGRRSEGKGGWWRGACCHIQHASVMAPSCDAGKSGAPKEQSHVFQAKIKELDAQRNEAFEALDQVVSAPQPQATAHLAQIRELEAQKRILEERCKTFSAWAEQKRLESSRYATECQRRKET